MPQDPVPLELFENDYTESNSDLAYLDIVTAAFGGAIFLLFVFATLPLDRAGGAGAANYIDVHISYPGDTVVELQVEHNGQMILRTLDATFGFEAKTGAARLAASPAFQNVIVTNKDVRRSATQQHLGFRILGPATGVWEVFANAAERTAPFGTAGSETIDLEVFASCAPPCTLDLLNTATSVPAQAQRETILKIEMP